MRLEGPIVAMFVACCIGCHSEDIPPPTLPQAETSPPPPDTPEIIPPAQESLAQFINALRSNDEKKHAFCLRARFEDGSRPTTEWLSPVSYDGDVFHATFRRHPYNDAFKFGDAVTIAPDNVVDWTFVDGDQVVGGFDIRKWATLPLQIDLPVLENAGTRKLSIQGESQDVAWFRITVDHNYLRTAAFWRTVPCPEGTVVAEVGNFGWIDAHGDGFVRIGGDGITFHAPDHCVVGPGQGSVSMTHWVWDQELDVSNAAIFKGGGMYHVFCFDEQPQRRTTNLAGEPATDFPSERPHLIGVISIEPVRDLSVHPQPTTIPITRDSLRSYTEEHFKTSSVSRTEDGKFVTSFDGKPSVSAPEAVIDNLVYALGTTIWQSERKPHRVARQVSRTTLTLKTEAGLRDFVMEYDNGALYMTTDEGHFMAPTPLLLFDVRSGIEAASINSD